MKWLLSYYITLFIVSNLISFVYCQRPNGSFVLDSELPFDCGFADITLKNYTQDIENNVTFGSWPWIGALFNEEGNKTYLIGNTILIHERITLASLRQTIGDKKLTVVFGRPGHNSRQTIKVSKIDGYRGYKYTFFDLDDISVLLLSRKVSISTYVRPVCLWEARENALDIYETDGILATVDDGEYERAHTLTLRYEPVRTLTAVLCMTLNFYNSENGFRYTEVSEQQLCIGSVVGAWCPPTSAALFFPRTTVDGRTQYYLRGIAIMRLLATNSPSEQCPFGSRKWVMIDVAQRRQLIDSHLKKKVRCGQRQLLATALIKGGNETKPGHWPWHVALFQKNLRTKNYDFACGGSSLNKYTVLTSGHCVTARGTRRVFNTEIFKLEFGRYFLHGEELTAQTRYVRKVILYPSYNGTSFKDDLCLLKLTTPALYNDYVQPICLWESDKLDKSYILEKYGKVVGWGLTSEGTTADKLQEISIPVINDTVCYQSHIFFSKFLNDDKFCAGFEDGTGVCNGDSGGGMYFGQVNEVDTVWYQRGIVSIGISIRNKTCDLSHYVLFTDVARYLDWIKQNLN